MNASIFSAAAWDAAALPVFVMAAALCLLALAVALVFFHRRALLESEALAGKVHMQQNALKARRQNLAKLQRLQSDMRGHLLYMQDALAQNRAADALDYAAALTSRNTQIVLRYASNQVADIALANAAALCEAKGLQFTVQGALPSRTLPDVELAALMYNLLDNAVEAAPQGGYVKISFIPAAGRLCIETENTAAPTAAHKPNPEAHGFGTSIIRRIAARYDGSYTLTCTPTQATATLMLALPQAAGQAG